MVREPQQKKATCLRQKMHHISVSGEGAAIVQESLLECACCLCLRGGRGSAERVYCDRTFCWNFPQIQARWLTPQNTSRGDCIARGTAWGMEWDALVRCVRRNGTRLIRSESAAGNMFCSGGGGGGIGAGLCLVILAGGGGSNWPPGILADPLTHPPTSENFSSGKK